MAEEAYIISADDLTLALNHVVCVQWPELENTYDQTNYVNKKLSLFCRFSKIHTHYNEQSIDSFPIPQEKKELSHFATAIHAECTVCLCLSSKAKGSKVIWLAVMRTLEDVWLIEKNLLPFRSWALRILQVIVTFKCTLTKRCSCSGV